MPLPNRKTNRLGVNRGFTLLEVLIASMILFLFITMASQAFSQSAQTSRKAERAVKVAAMVPLLVETIRGQIMAVDTPQNVGGEGQMLEVQYHWQATLIHRKPPAARFDPSAMEFKTYEDRFNLWSVEVVVSIGTYQRSWLYEEISWFK
ncbi:MAG: type II secretion system protein [Algicola sp.]|nr:type II secretion system protein [Algicola sp.]